MNLVFLLKENKKVDIFYKVVALLGGLAMFLYGMRLMGDGLKQSSGSAMKVALAKVTNRPVIGFIFGMLVTCMIQSSTATIVLTVGLVGAGFLTFYQSIGIVLGANVGTAITAQIIRLMDVSAGTTSILYFFKADNLAPMALIFGIICIMFLKGDRLHNVGTILIGFGILFMGLIFMSDSVGQMSDQLSRLLVAFEDNYFFGFLSGVFVTGIIQSSSAVVGILQSMASSVGVRFCGVFAVIIGVNIGDCLTTYLVSRIGAKPDQIRTVTVHVIYNIFAALLISTCVAIGRFTGLIGDGFWNSTLNSGGVANVHGAFRLIPAVVLLPLTGVFAKIAVKIVPDEPVDNKDADIENNLRELDSRLFSNPVLAMSQSKHLILHMADVALHNFDASIEQVRNYDEARDKRIMERESLLDRMADASNQYLVDMSAYIVQESDARRQGMQIKALTCYERIGDHAVNISKDMKNLAKNGGVFSEEARKDLDIAFVAVKDILELTYRAFQGRDGNLARQVEPREEVIDELIETLKNYHIKRMTKGICDLYSGIQFENILSNLERISDLCSDLAISILGSLDLTISGAEHDYVHKLHHSDDFLYQKNLEENYTRYFDMLKESREQADSKSGQGLSE